MNALKFIYDHSGKITIAAGAITIGVATGGIVLPAMLGMTKGSTFVAALFTSISVTTGAATTKIVKEVAEIRADLQNQNLNVEINNLEEKNNNLQEKVTNCLQTINDLAAELAARNKEHESNIKKIYHDFEGTFYSLESKFKKINANQTEIKAKIQSNDGEIDFVKKQVNINKDQVRGGQRRCENINNKLNNHIKKHSM
ncbi:hypothetical protein N9L02_01440 [Gammaproteobacteria bacterium]|nr:hypothetical protein [Gammaproteobacteria bacterium]